MHAIPKLKTKIEQHPSNYISSIQEFKLIDLKTLSKQLKIEEKGQARGKNEQTLSTSDELDNAEN